MSQINFYLEIKDDGVGTSNQWPRLERVKISNNFIELCETNNIEPLEKINTMIENTVKFAEYEKNNNSIKLREYTPEMIENRKKLEEYEAQGKKVKIIVEE